MQNYKEQVTVTRLSVTYSLISQAIQNMIGNETTIDTWGAKEERAVRFEELLPKYLQIVKVCPKRTKGCMSPNGYSNRFDDSVSTSIEDVSNSYLLKNGVGIRVKPSGTCQQDMTLEKKGCDEADKDCERGAIRNYGSYAHNCMSIYIDINGPAKPNKFDVDMFYFPVLQDGIIPSGSFKEQIWTETFENQCAGKNVYNGGGGHCSAWVIYNKNMDYLRCPDKLGWDKAFSCK